MQKSVNVSLDSDTAEIIKKLQTEYQVSKSEIVRKALTYLNTVTQGGKERTDPQELDTIIKLTSRPDTVLIDLSILRALEEKVENNKKFRKEIRDIGRGLYHQYNSSPDPTINDILKTFEKFNLFTITTNKNGRYTLYITSLDESFLKELLEGLFDEINQEAKIRKSHGKIIPEPDFRGAEN